MKIGISGPSHHEIDKRSGSPKSPAAAPALLPLKEKKKCLDEGSGPTMRARVDPSARRVDISTAPREIVLASRKFARGWRIAISRTRDDDTHKHLQRFPYTCPPQIRNRRGAPPGYQFIPCNLLHAGRREVGPFQVAHCNAKPGRLNHSCACSIFTPAFCPAHQIEASTSSGHPAKEEDSISSFSAWLSGSQRSGGLRVRILGPKKPRRPPTADDREWNFGRL